MSDDDWFEAAVVDEEATEADEGAAEADEEATEADEEAAGADEGAAESGNRAGGEPDDSSGEADDESLATEIPSGSGGAADDGEGTSPGDESADAPPDVGGDVDGGSGTGDGGEGLFEEDFTAALQETDLEDEGLEREPPDPTDEAFAMGTDAGGGFGDVGVSDLDGDLDSDIPRIELGIEGLDEMIQGGVPERSLMVAIGSAGTGKTTFGLQFLHEGLESGERGIYITLEETRERVIRSATEKGFAFDEYADSGQLAVVDLDPVEMANSLETIGSELPRLVEDFGASRLVLDSVSLLEMMYDDRAARRNEIYDFAGSLKASGVTTVLTSEASEENAYNSRHGIVEYLTDAVFVLQYVRPSDFRETRLAIEIQKIRDANHSRETKPYEITSEGIDVYRQANLF